MMVGEWFIWCQITHLTTIKWILIDWMSEIGWIFIYFEQLRLTILIFLYIFTCFTMQQQKQFTFLVSD